VNFIKAAIQTQSRFKFSGIGFCFLVVFLCLFPAWWALADEEEYVERVFLTKKQALKLAFPGIRKFKRNKVWLTDSQKKAVVETYGDKIDKSRLTFFEALREDGTMAGVMTIGNEIGRSYPITFMVVINTDGTVKDVEIMVYREPHGWEVRFETFMSQFFGRDANDPFNNINNITGATLSVRSMTKGVKKAVSVYKVLYLDKVK
jgi:Na+-translocating ferredoxin:NAD+ oxidoreductase RnfG subunit